YGVVVGATDATAERRLEIRTERLGREPAATRADVEPAGFRLSEYLQRTAADGPTQCTWCGIEVAPPGVDWKDHAVARRVPVDEAGPLRTAADDFAILKACGPG